MKIYQRMLYVGLGGTGLKIGAQLEQVLRLELCGAHGRALLDHAHFRGTLKPYQLPRFVQFVYADFDQRERDNVRTASERLTRAAAARESATFISRLTPAATSYSAVRESLQTECFPVVKHWLPRADNEPRVSPLQDGAGQLPTVGRAALFETILKQGLGVVQQPLQQAVARLAQSGGDLSAFLGRDAAPRGCDVFVGFSAAGGTGAGLFYDFLHLICWQIREVFEQDGPDSNVHVYPLVVMPSAFSGDERVDLRQAQLNGGQALRELFGLIDDHNTGTRRQPITYPGNNQAAMGGQVDVQTAFVFDRPSAISLDDLHRSIVAFVRSLIGTEYEPGPGAMEGSFASSFINRASGRNVPASDGIGYRPASTALAAQLTIPGEDIAEILASRLLAQAVNELGEPKQTENNREALQAFISTAGLANVWQRPSADQLPGLPSDATGATELSKKLRERRKAAVALVRAHRRTLDADVPQVAEQVNVDRAIKELAPLYDLLRLARIFRGDSRLVEEDRVNREGFSGFARRRMEPLRPPADSGFQPNEPPPIPELRDTFAGMRKVPQSDPRVTAALKEQADWYQWRTRAEWHTAWGKYRAFWESKVNVVRETLNDIVDAFERHAQAEPEAFREACNQLYNARQGVVYFLPEGGDSGDLNLFYETSVLPRLREKHGEAEVGAILNKIVQDAWVDAYQEGQRAPDHAVEAILLRVRAEIHALLTTSSGDRQPPLLPPLSELLVAAAGGGEGANDPLVQRFRAGISALRPAGFEPAGSAALQVQIFYPAAGPSNAIEGFLRNALDESQSARCTQIADSNFLAVVLTREAIPSTEIEEYRELLRIWADAIDNPRLENRLPWRQRLGFDSRWVVLTEEDRIRVMLRILNAMWDGSVQILAGTPESPERLIINQYDSPEAPPIDLDLRAYGSLSRWSNVLRAYERYAIQSGGAVTQRCAQLMKRMTPAGVADEPAAPSSVYRTFRSIVEVQQRLAEDNYASVAEAAKPVADQAREFWTKIVPAALAEEFIDGGGPRGRNHETLYASFEHPVV